MAWTDELETTIKADLKKRPAAVAKAQDRSTFWLFGFIVLCVVCVYVVAQNRNSSPFIQQQQQQPYNNYYSQWDATQQPQAYNPYAYNDYNNYQQPPMMGVEQKLERLESAAKKIWDRTKWNSDRLVLLTTVNNHNTVVIRNGYPRSELIYFNSDWTINRMPDRIYLDRNDQEFLRQYIKK